MLVSAVGSGSGWRGVPGGPTGATVMTFLQNKRNFCTNGHVSKGETSDCCNFSNRHGVFALIGSSAFS